MVKQDVNPSLHMHAILLNNNTIDYLKLLTVAYLTKASPNNERLIVTSRYNSAVMLEDF